MADVQQLLQGMVEMNDSVAEAEERAADAGILAAANNIERKGESPIASTQLEQSRRSRRSISHRHSIAKTTDGETTSTCFAGRFSCGAFAEIHVPLDSHINDPAAIKDRSLRC